MSSKGTLGIQLLRQGDSYNQIKSQLRVAKGTISGWFSSLSLEDKEKIKALRIRNWRKNIKRYQKNRRFKTLEQERIIQEKASKKIGRLTLRELFLVGISLYWAEGAKGNRWQLQFSNSDPLMVRLMMEFFRKVFQIKESKFYLQMVLHRNIDENKALNYWSQVTGIAQRQFKKACYSKSKRSKGKRNKKQLPYGTLQIRILDKQDTQEMYGYIFGLKQIKT